MFRLIKRLFYVGVILVMAFPLVSCSGGGESGTVGGPTWWVTDAQPQATYKEVWVTITEVQVKQNETDAWTIVTGLDLPLEQELLMLRNGARVELGIADLEPGHYSQMRLILSDVEGDNWVIDSDDNRVELKVPSGGQTGIKLVNGFDIASASTDIILDFDVHRSIYVHPAGHTEKWVLRPTVRVVEIGNSVTGTVFEEDGTALEDARVSVWSSDSEMPSTLSEPDGTYFMNLPVNVTGTPYNMVATKDDFIPECQSLGSTASGVYTGVNFTLTPVTTTYELEIDITGLPVPPEPEPGEEPETFVGAFSIMQEIDCSGDDVPDTMIEVGLYNFVNADGTDIAYDLITLPVGDYEIFAWTVDAGEVEINLGPIGITIVDSNVAQTIDFSL